MKTALLVLDDELERANELCLLLRFLEEKNVAQAGFSNWQSHVANNADLRCVFLGRRDAVERPPIDAMYAIRGLAPRVPLILIEESGEPIRLPATLEASCGGHLAHPFQYGPLSQLLGRLQAMAARDHRGSDELASSRRNVELFRSLSGYSDAMLRVRELLQRVAPSESTVMVLGESGTGKEVVARNIHYFSNRNRGPFVPVNCGAIPDNLLESELFGHEKGAFTGAISARRGRFELARGGTLFLDEIGDMPLNMQVKLLRVLQERVFERVGSDRSLEADVRIVTATHRDLEEMIRAGSFREDLYYRLNVFPIEMPSLRERIEDLPRLVEELVARMAQEIGVRVTLSPATLQVLSYYPWPGNVRELANVVERLAILKPNGQIEPSDLPAKLRAYAPAEPKAVAPVSVAPPTTSDNATEDTPPRLPVAEITSLPPNGLDLRQYITDLESSLIQEALEGANGVVAHAASLLRMRRTTLVEKMRKYNIRRGDDELED